MDLLISLISGAMFGNVLAGVAPRFDRGFALNSLLGISGGAVLAQLVQVTGAGRFAGALMEGSGLGALVLALPVVAGGLGGMFALLTYKVLRG